MIKNFNDALFFLGAMIFICVFMFTQSKALDYASGYNTARNDMQELLAKYSCFEKKNMTNYTFIRYDEAVDVDYGKPLDVSYITNIS